MTEVELTRNETSQCSRDYLLYAREWIAKRVIATERVIGVQKSSVIDAEVIA